jgi:hypothetical protein
MQIQAWVKRATEARCTSVPMCTSDVRNDAGPMTEIGNGEAESAGNAMRAARVSPPVEFDILYIGQPTIPAGMTVETYRRVRPHRKRHRFRRLASLAL